MEAQLSLLDYATAARNKALKKIEGNNEEWMRLGLLVIGAIAWDVPEFTGEELRAKIIPSIGQPTHPNAWGCLIGIAVRRKLIFDTGRTRRMTSATSHARKTPIYRFEP